jgi:glycine betaine catabolism B
MSAAVAPTGFGSAAAFRRSWTAALASVLDGTSMYRLVLVYLGGLLAFATVLSAFGVLPAKPADIVASTALLAATALGVQWIFTRLLRVPWSAEPALITAFILALIADPVSPLTDPGRALVLAFAAAAAVASKFLIAPRRQHIFNPAALGIYAVGMLFHEYSTWWVGNAALLPAVALGGLLVVRKVGRLRVVALFLAAFAVYTAVFALLQGVGIGDAVAGVGFVFLHTSVLFFALVMLTEPITTPKRFVPQAIHAAIVAVMMLPQLSVFGVTFSPEAALLVGNVFARLTGRSARFALQLRDRREVARGVHCFTFDRPRGWRHLPGQYMEWVLPLAKGDSRGNRRSFTISSSPTEPELSFAVRVPDRPSAYKRALMGLRLGDTIIASELSGDFVMPGRKDRPIVLIAGGIGITPFRAMLRYLLDRGERRDVTLITSTFGPDEIAFSGELEEARRRIGVRVVHTLTDPRRVPGGWNGRVGFVDAAMIADAVPGYGSAAFYVSGPPAMVKGVKAALRVLGVRRLKTDFFPGYSV